MNLFLLFSFYIEVDTLITFSIETPANFLGKDDVMDWNFQL